jgi:TPR repeat protein
MAISHYLAKLQLLRNDPELIPPIRAAAEAGLCDAQYALGLIYAEGRGLPVDLAQAHFWLSRAIAQGDKDAEVLRNIVGAQMNEAEYAAAKRLAAGPRLTVVGDLSGVS